MSRVYKTKDMLSIQKRILEEKGYQRDNSKLGIRNHPTITEGKSPLQTVLEWQFGAPIEELIWSDSIRCVAERLGVTRDTVSKWRRKWPLKDGDYYVGKGNRKLPIPKSNGNHSV